MTLPLLSSRSGSYGFCSAAKRSNGAPTRQAKRPGLLKCLRSAKTLGWVTLTLSGLVMTELSDEFRLDAPLENAFWSCREAVANMD